MSVGGQIDFHHLLDVPRELRVPRRLPYDILLSIIENTEDRSTLYRLALTCWGLSDFALAELWHTMDSVVPLLLMMPMEFYDQDDLRIPEIPEIPWSSPPTLHLPEEGWGEIPADSPCFARMLAYGKRIRVLRGLDSNRLNVSYQAFQFLVDYLPRHLLRVKHIIPNLTELSFVCQELTCSEFSLQIRELLVSSLRSIVFTFDCMGLHENVNTVILAVLQNCPKLESLEIVCTGKFCEDQPPSLLDFGHHLKFHPEEVQMLSVAARATPLRIVQVTSLRLSGYCDIVCTPTTLVVLGAFRSVTYLTVSLDTADQFQHSPLFEGPGSAFPSLQSLRLRLHGSDPVTWFFLAINAANLLCLYLHFVQDLSTSELDTFMSSLDPFRKKLSGVRAFALRATVYQQEDRSEEPHGVIRSMVVAAARLSPALSHLKLKLFPSYNPQQGLVRADDLPHITGAFPDLRSLKLATSSHHVNLTDVVSLARRFPGLRTIGMDFQCFGIDTLHHDQPSGSLPPSELLSLDVRHSAIQQPEQVAAYLRESLPRLCTVGRSRKSTHDEWDVVHELLRDRA